MSEKCPYCNGEMVKGYIQCRDGVYWSEKVRQISALPPMDKSRIVLDYSSEGGPFKGGVVEAYNCLDCKKLIVSYED